MAVQTLENETRNTLVVRVHGSLTREDYGSFLPEIERLARASGRIRVLFLMDAVRGWDAPVGAKEVAPSSRHCSAIERLAVVGDKRWEHWMDAFSVPLVDARVGYFDPAQEREARRWLATD